MFGISQTCNDFPIARGQKMGSSFHGKVCAATAAALAAAASHAAIKSDQNALFPFPPFPITPEGGAPEIKTGSTQIF